MPWYLQCLRHCTLYTIGVGRGAGRPSNIWVTNTNIIPPHHEYNYGYMQPDHSNFCISTSSSAKGERLNLLVHILYNEFTCKVISKLVPKMLTHSLSKQSHLEKGSLQGSASVPAVHIPAWKIVCWMCLSRAFFVDGILSMAWFFWQNRSRSPNLGDSLVLS